MPTEAIVISDPILPNETNSPAPLRSSQQPRLHMQLQLVVDDIMCWLMVKGIALWATSHWRKRTSHGVPVWLATKAGQKIKMSVCYVLSKI